MGSTHALPDTNSFKNIPTSTVSDMSSPVTPGTRTDSEFAETIDIWTWSLTVTPEVSERLTTLMTCDEIARARRFVRIRDQLHFIAGRGRMREILAHYTGMNPRRVPISYNAFGKPCLSSKSMPELHFNLSHSSGHAALAVSRRFDVGIDIERVKPFSEDISDRFFSVAECADLRRHRTGNGDYFDAFYRCWTRKEAFVKANGAGLSMPLDCFDVTIDPKERPAIKRLEGDRDPSENWTLLDVQLPSGFAGAVAVLSVGNPVSLRYRNLGDCLDRTEDRASALMPACCV